MKYSFCKLVALLAINFLAVHTLAQDIIVTNDSKKIEAKILEVSKTEIKYKELDNLEGPTFVLGVEDINSIIYANGKVVLYSEQQSAGKAETEHIAQAETEQNVIVDFEIERTSNPLWFNFINLSSGATDFRWDFGDGTWSYAPDKAMHTYEKKGTYTVTLTANVGSCKYTQRKTLKFEEQPRAQQEQKEATYTQAAESGALLGYKEFDRSK